MTNSQHFKRLKKATDQSLKLAFVFLMALSMAACQTQPDSLILDGIGSGNGYSVEDLTSLSLRGLVQSENESSNGTDCYLIFTADLSGQDDKRPSEDQVKLGLKSFRLGLAYPNAKFWANLNPSEPERIVEKELADTDAGRIMLEADLQMKRDFSKYENPCQYQIGEDYWKLLYEKREELANSLCQQYPAELKNASNINFAAAIRNWIVPGKIYALEDGEGFFIINYTLEINQEPAENYSSTVLQNIDPSRLSTDCQKNLRHSAIEYGRYAAQLQEEMILPLVEKEVNQDEKYSDLRRVYSALGVAQWYKSHYSGEVEGLANLSGSWSITWNPKTVWQDYVVSFKDGEVKCWQTVSWNNTTITTYNLTSNDTYDITDYYYNQSTLNKTTWSRSTGISTDLNDSLATDKKIKPDVNMGVPKYESLENTAYSISSYGNHYIMGGVDYSWILENQINAGSFHDTVGKQFFESLMRDSLVDPAYSMSVSSGLLGVVYLVKQPDGSAKFKPAQTTSISFGEYILSSWYYALNRQLILWDLSWN